jgi:hypothetical protein
MLQDDRIIAVTVFGWTEDEWEMNDWYDEFFDLWRPKPKSKKEMYPSWSESNKDAMDLIAYLTEHGFEVKIGSKDGLYYVNLTSDYYSSNGYDDSIPHALAEAIIDLKDVLKGALKVIDYIKEVIGKDIYE